MKVAYRRLLLGVDYRALPAAALHALFGKSDVGKVFLKKGILPLEGLEPVIDFVDDFRLFTGSETSE